MVWLNAQPLVKFFTFDSPDISSLCLRFLVRKQTQKLLLFYVFLVNYTFAFDNLVVGFTVELFIFPQVTLEELEVITRLNTTALTVTNSGII